MPIFRSLILVLVTLVPLARSQSVEITEPPPLDGRMWNALPLQTKVYYVMGYEDAVILICKIAGARAPDEPLLRLGRFYPNGMSPATLQWELTTFYQDGANLRIAIRDAIQIVAAKTAKVPADEIERRIARLRAEARAPQPKSP